MTTPQDITDLIQRVASRDSAAFGKLYDATSAKLFGIIIRILRRQEVAEEILQDVFVTVWNRASAFDPGVASPITWLAAIARNRAIDEVRRKAPIATSPADLEKFLDATSMLQESEHRDEMIVLRGCLEALEPQRREMILLAYFEGFSREAIAERYACPVNSVKTWLRRSLQQLRDCLG